MIQDNCSLHIFLADDDKDDQILFRLTLEELPVTASLETASNGAILMSYLATAEELPDVLFLDLNMPLKNGEECLAEIKQDDRLKQIPVIIYSTSLREDVADRLYEMGAHYYLQKSELAELRENLLCVLETIVRNKFVRPPRNEFIVRHHQRF